MPKFITVVVTNRSPKTAKQILNTDFIVNVQRTDEGHTKIDVADPKQPYSLKVEDRIGDIWTKLVRLGL